MKLHQRALLTLTFVSVASVASVAVGVEDSAPLLIYMTKELNQTFATKDNTWDGFKAGARWSYLRQLYFANTREKSKSGKHHVGCFIGDSQQVVRKFFNNQQIKFVDQLVATPSSDGKLIGIDFKYSNFNDGKRDAKGKPVFKSGTSHFRLPHCYSGGKGPLILPEEIKEARQIKTNENRLPAADETNQELLDNSAEKGFEIIDVLTRENETQARSLPRFKIRADYSDIKVKPESRPWKGMDVSSPVGAKKFTDTLIAYFYDGMIQNPRDANMNFIAQKSPKKKTQWCHMPWLNVGEAGRELIHGLTKERDLRTSAMYPEAGTTLESQGSNWGIGYYNDIGCQQIDRVFGSVKNPNKDPQFTNIKFDDGTVSLKILFTSAQFRALQGAFEWIGHISLPGSTERKLVPIRMLQMDVAIKDSTLIGSRPEVNHWVMATYYYDQAYKMDERLIAKLKIPKNFEGLEHMRPVGIQTGFDPLTSMIFKDSRTNSKQNEYYREDDKLLNGPADNFKGSCLGCHGVAGTRVPFIPGAKDFAHYQEIKKDGLDFSMQLGLAKGNYETRAGQKNWEQRK